MKMHWDPLGPPLALPCFPHPPPFPEKSADIRSPQLKSLPIRNIPRDRLHTQVSEQIGPVQYEKSRPQQGPQRPSKDS